jgi:hypothetical protein
LSDFERWIVAQRILMQTVEISAEALTHNGLPWRKPVGTCPNSSDHILDLADVKCRSYSQTMLRLMTLIVAAHPRGVVSSDKPALDDCGWPRTGCSEAISKAGNPIRGSQHTHPLPNNGPDDGNFKRDDRAYGTRAHLMSTRTHHPAAVAEARSHGSAASSSVLDPSRRLRKHLSRSASWNISLGPEIEGINLDSVLEDDQGHTILGTSNSRSRSSSHLTVRTSAATEESGGHVLALPSLSLPLAVSEEVPDCGSDDTEEGAFRLDHLPSHAWKRSRSQRVIPSKQAETAAVDQVSRKSMLSFGVLADQVCSA